MSGLQIYDLVCEKNKNTVAAAPYVQNFACKNSYLKEIFRRYVLPADGTMTLS